MGSRRRILPHTIVVIPVRPEHDLAPETAIQQNTPLGVVKAVGRTFEDLSPGDVVIIRPWTQRQGQHLKHWVHPKQEPYVVSEGDVLAVLEEW